MIAWIYAKKGVFVQFAQDLKIKTDGILSFEKHLLRCNCVCQKVECDSKKSAFIGGNLTAYESITLNNIGNEKEIKTFVNILDKESDKVKAKIEELKKLKQKMAKEIEPVQREVKGKMAIMKRAGASATPNQKKEIKKWVEQYNSMVAKAKYIDKKINELNDHIENPDNLNGYVKVNNEAFPGVEINMYGKAKKELKKVILSSTKFFLKDDKVIAQEVNNEL